MSAPPPLPQAAAVRRSRNRALLIVLSLVVLLGGAVVVLFLKMQSHFLDSREYTDAMALVQRSPVAVAKLGDGIERDGMISATMNTSFASDQTSTLMSVPVAGTRAAGTVVFTATRRGEEVRITRMELITEVDGRQASTLLVDPASE